MFVLLWEASLSHAELILPFSQHQIPNRLWDSMQVYWQHKAAVKAAAEERLRMSLYKSPGKVPTYR